MLTKKQEARMLRDMKTLPEMLQEWRDLLKITDSEAARRCQMSAQHWFQLVNGQRADPRGATFRKLSEGTGIPLERLIAAAEFGVQAVSVTT